MLSSNTAAAPTWKPSSSTARTSSKMVDRHASTMTSCSRKPRRAALAPGTTGFSAIGIGELSSRSTLRRFRRARTKQDKPEQEFSRKELKGRKKGKVLCASRNLGDATNCAHPFRIDRLI